MQKVWLYKSVISYMYFEKNTKPFVIDGPEGQTDKEVPISKFNKKRIGIVYDDDI